MSKRNISISWDNLDMVTTSSVKKKRLLSINPVIFVNSVFFLRSHRNGYALQIDDVSYSVLGLLETSWELINNKKYKEAKQMFDKILAFSPNLSRAHYGKFICALEMNKDGFPHLKQAIETKRDSINDDAYRLYIKLYANISDISDDYQPLIELLAPPKKIVAFNKNSYNGNYLEFIHNIEIEKFDDAATYLDICLGMKRNDSVLELAKKLLDKVIVRFKELEESRANIEKELEIARCQNFAAMVKQGDINAARKELEKILSYRNAEGRDNYIYYLFLELIEMIMVASEDITFEIMPVTYAYTRPDEAMYTFFEALSIGDFKTALISGKKCKGKLLDRSQPAIKVNVYLQLLEYFFNLFEERQKEMDNVYQIIRNNIQRGKFKHALELYEVNGEYLHAFKEDLIHDLFTKGIEIENEDPVIYEEVDPEVAFDYVEDELDEIPAEVLEAEEEKLLDEYEEIEKVVSVEEIPVSRQVVQLYQVQPLLNHPEPQHEYFLNYQECLNNGEFEDARIWLAKFDRLLKDNNLRKRLSHHFYKIDAAIKDKNSGTHAEKEKLYNQAYNFMMNKSYESAIEYLELYISLDENINIKGYILLGKVHALNGDYEEAIRNYIYANSISPDPDAHYFLGEMYFKKRRWHEAIFSYLAYNEFYPKENATVYLNLSECYKRIGRTNKVVKYLKIAEEINVEQKMGLYLKNRILKAEQISKRKDEHFQIQRNSNMSTIEQ